MDRSRNAVTGRDLSRRNKKTTNKIIYAFFLGIPVVWQSVQWTE
jgi:hypothetical protein